MRLLVLGAILTSIAVFALPMQRVESEQTPKLGSEASGLEVGRITPSLASTTASASSGGNEGGGETEGSGSGGAVTQAVPRPGVMGGLDKLESTVASALKTLIGALFGPPWCFTAGRLAPIWKLVKPLSQLLGQTGLQVNPFLTSCNK